jgi:hypothetical protein
MAELSMRSHKSFNAQLNRQNIFFNYFLRHANNKMQTENPNDVKFATILSTLIS